MPESQTVFVNVPRNSLATAVIARREGEFNTESEKIPAGRIHEAFRSN